MHAQTLDPIEVIVCFRSSDLSTKESLSQLPQSAKRLVREMVLGPEDNFARALDAGIRGSRGDLVALTDDDAVVPRDWVERLTTYFDDPLVAGVGGRDVQPYETWEEPVVGVVKWWGKLVGNHHLGAGASRDVDVLKGVNCCFRGDLLRSRGIDPRLKGSGTVIHTELAICLPLRRSGYRLIYDPTLRVEHRIAPRGDGDLNTRGGFSAGPFRDRVHNETLCLLEHLSPMQRHVYRTWSRYVGTRGTPGLVQMVRLALLGGESLGNVRTRVQTAAEGRRQGYETWRATSRCSVER